MGGWVGEGQKLAPSAWPLSFPKWLDTAAVGYGACGWLGEGAAEETCVILEGMKMAALASKLEVPVGEWEMGMVA